MTRTSTLTEKKLKKSLHQQKILAEIAIDLNQYDDFDKVMNDILKKIALQVGASRSYIFEDSSDGSSTTNTFEWCGEGVEPEIDNLQNVPYSEIPSFLQDLSKKGMFVSSDVKSLPKGLRDHLEKQGIKSLLVLPLKARRKQIGFIGFDQIDEPRKWEESEINLLKTISGSIASVYERIRSAKEMDRVKTEFIFVASHQLKTPLARIRWMSELLLKQSLSKEAQKYANDIVASTKSLIVLAEDLLSASRMENGHKFVIKKKKTDIVKIVKDVKRNNREFAQQKEIEIAICADLSKKILLNIDQEKIKQVFNNLLHNALKYSPQNSQITIQCQKKKDNVVFTIADQGIGIPEDQQDQVFSRFFRADNAMKSETEGTGLGLYIAKAIIEAHGGTIEFESKKNQGTIFTVVLPI